MNFNIESYRVYYFNGYRVNKRFSIALHKGLVDRGYRLKKGGLNGINIILNTFNNCYDL